ncbi:MAG TPA: hypothetical protein VMH05_25870 [Bryobacteraceae bacterium]|nr:hypothetical protein [Bryobacteraceae bacterium]
MARHQFAVIALLGIAVASIFWVLLDVARAYSHSSTSYGVENFENRFADLPKAATPKTVFGYISDNRPEDPSDQAEFYLTQYTLAPAIVVSTINEREVVANMHSANPDMKPLQARGFVPVRNFGNGIFLYRNISVR